VKARGCDRAALDGPILETEIPRPPDSGAEEESMSTQCRCQLAAIDEETHRMPQR